MNGNFKMIFNKPRKVLFDKVIFSFDGVLPIPRFKNTKAEYCCLKIESLS